MKTLKYDAPVYKQRVIFSGWMHRHNSRGGLWIPKKGIFQRAGGLRKRVLA